MIELTNSQIILGSSVLSITATSFYLLRKKFTSKPKDKISRRKIQIRHEIVTFLGVTFSICTSIVAVQKTILPRIPNLIIAVSFMVVPSIVSTILDKYIWKKKEEEKPQKSILQKLYAIYTNKWVYAGVASIFGINILTFLINLLFPNVSFSLNADYLLELLSQAGKPKESIEKSREMVKMMKMNPLSMLSLSIIQCIVAGSTLNALFGYGEERGWREYLLERFDQLGFGFWQNSFLTGLIWGFWHFPVILCGHNYPTHPRLGVLWMTISAALLSPLFHYFTEKANTVPKCATASIMHGVFNASYMLSGMFLKGGNCLTNCLFGVSGWIALTLTNCFLYYQRKEKNSQFKK
jgi:hypothetical protein